MSEIIHMPSMVTSSGLSVGASLTVIHTEELVGVRSSFTHEHGRGRIVLVRYVDRAGCEVEVGVSHNADLTETTVTSVVPMDGFLYFY